jgi:hypothetical protein
MPARKDHVVVAAISAPLPGEALAEASPVSGEGWHGSTILWPDGRTGFAAFAPTVSGRTQPVPIDTPQGKVVAAAVACSRGEVQWLYAADAIMIAPAGRKPLRFSRPVDVTVVDGAVTIASDAPFEIEGGGRFPAGKSTLP